MQLSNLPKHHAVLVVVHDRQKEAENLFEKLQELSPAHTFFNQTVLDIESARKIISWVNTPYNEEKIALISFHTIGLEAQNALLKILEEPRQGVRFILITTNVSNLIPTVLSRVHLLTLNKQSEELISEASLFLQTEPLSRMKLPSIITILAKEDEEGRKDRESVKAFITSLASVLKNKKGKSHHVEEILEVASYASDPSASGKALLEYLSLLLPQTKV